MHALTCLNVCENDLGPCNVSSSTLAILPLPPSLQTFFAEVHFKNRERGQVSFDSIATVALKEFESLSNTHK